MPLCSQPDSGERGEKRLSQPSSEVVGAQQMRGTAAGGRAGRGAGRQGGQRRAWGPGGAPRLPSLPGGKCRAGGDLQTT